MLAGVAALATGAAPSFAAYGDSANVFGKITNKSGERAADAGGMGDSGAADRAAGIPKQPPRRSILGWGMLRGANVA